MDSVHYWIGKSRFNSKNYKSYVIDSEPAGEGHNDSTATGAVLGRLQRTPRRQSRVTNNNDDDRNNLLFYWSAAQ